MATLSALRVTLLMLPLTVSLSAQTPGMPGPAPITPVQTRVPVDPPLNPALPTLFIVGDSTARNRMDLGWGDHVAGLFDTSRINVANRAVAGRSSRSYYNEGRWEKVLSEMKPGDYVLIQMGHNDGGGDPAADPKARSSVKGLGDETAEFKLAKPFESGPIAGQKTETVHTYGWYIRRYIGDARAKQANPILLTLTVRNIWAKGADGRSHIERDMGFRSYESQLASTEHVPIIDMATAAADAFEGMGPEATANMFPIDHTHTSPAGAELNAHAVVTALRAANSPLVAYLRP